jgi:hypothetical protein
MRRICCTAHQPSSDDLASRALRAVSLVAWVA